MKYTFGVVFKNLLVVLLLSGGVGMLLQGALMLTDDVFAERRGLAYTT